MNDILDYFEEGWPKVLGVPDEWLDDIYVLHNFIKLYSDRGYVKDYKIHQVKQKFGGLRFYYSLTAGEHGLIPDYYHKDFFVNQIAGAVMLTEMKCDENL